MNTPHHNVMLKCKTLLDKAGEEEDYDTDSVADEESIDGTSMTTQSRERNTHNTLSTPTQGTVTNEKKELEDIESNMSKYWNLNFIHGFGCLEENTPTNFRPSLSGILDKVVEICGCLSQVTLCDLREKLPETTEREISQCLAQLSLKGALIRSYRPNTFIVESRHEYFKKDILSKADFETQNNNSFSNSSIRGRVGSNGPGEKSR
eukprot:g962.t1